MWQNPLVTFPNRFPLPLLSATGAALLLLTVTILIRTPLMGTLQIDLNPSLTLRTLSPGYRVISERKLLLVSSISAAARFSPTICLTPTSEGKLPV